MKIRGKEAGCPVLHAEFHIDSDGEKSLLVFIEFPGRLHRVRDGGLIGAGPSFVVPAQMPPGDIVGWELVVADDNERRELREAGYNFE